MRLPYFVRNRLCSLLIVGSLPLAAWSGTDGPRADSSRSAAYRIPIAEALPSSPEHPLTPVLSVALDSYRHIRRDIRDYTCILVRRERVDGRLQEHEYLSAKVRHQRQQNGQVSAPFAVYLNFLAPAAVNGRQVLYVAGQNDGEIFVRNGGQRFAYVTTRLRPDSELAMRDNRYPVTEFGFENLIRRLIEVAREEMALTQKCQVTMYRDAKVNGRQCVGVQVTHLENVPGLRYYQAKVYMDKQWRIPIHFESYDWPRSAGDEPRLLEQYTYMDIKLNVGLSDADFDHTNPRYQLR